MDHDFCHYLGLELSLPLASWGVPGARLPPLGPACHLWPSLLSAVRTRLACGKVLEPWRNCLDVCGYHQKSVMQKKMFKSLYWWVYRQLGFADLVFFLHRSCCSQPNVCGTWDVDWDVDERHYFVFAWQSCEAKKHYHPTNMIPGWCFSKLQR